MTDREFKLIIDELWLAFASSGISNPISVIEQLTYLIFFKMYEHTDNIKQKRAEKRKISRKSFFEGRDNLRWSKLVQETDPNKLLKTYREKVFPLLGEINSAFEDAACLIIKPSLLDTAVQTIDKMDFSDGSDSKGDIYEYMLSNISTSGKNGQFRTPRHIIDMMVNIIEPTPEDSICDPASGTSGFLCRANWYILSKNTSEDMKEISPILGDKLSDADRKKLDESVFHGREFDITMYRIGLMNLILHNIKPDNSKHQDSLSKDAQEEDKYTLILANPPFTGSLDSNDVDPHLTSIVKTKKTELLFLAKIIKMLQIGGRAAVIIPDGVLFGTSNAHKAIRTKLLDQNQLEAVISMPSGVFKPYAGVSTAVLVFTKGGQTLKTWFYDMQNDGFTLNDNRTPIEYNDIPDIIKSFKNRHKENNTDRKAKHFFVDADEIRNNGYDLSINKYKEVEYEEIQYEEPSKILADIKQLESEIQTSLDELEEMI